VAVIWKRYLFTRALLPDQQWVGAFGVTDRLARRPHWGDGRRSSLFRLEGLRRNMHHLHRRLQAIPAELYEVADATVRPLAAVALVTLAEIGQTLIPRQRAQDERLFQSLRTLRDESFVLTFSLFSSIFTFHPLFN